MVFIFKSLFQTASPYCVEEEYAARRRALRLAGLSERTLRRMDPDDRVRALEQAKLDPYDYIYLAC